MAKKRLLPVNVLVVLTSLVVTVFVCEGALRLLGFPAAMPPRTAHPPGFHEVRRHIEFTHDFRTNSQGLRYREIPLGKQPNQRRVFVVGDSFAEGWGVDEEDRFTDLLERSFGGSEGGVLFINGGLTGGGLLEYGRLFFDKGVKYDPDGLLICVYANDICSAPDLVGETNVKRPGQPAGRFRWVRGAWPRLHTLVVTRVARDEYRRRAKTKDFVRDVSNEAVRRGIPRKRIDAWRESLPGYLVDAINEGRFVPSVLSYGLFYPTYWTDSIDIFSATAQAKWKNAVHVLTETIDRSRGTGVEPAVVFIPCCFMYDPASHDESNPWVRTGTVVRARWIEETTQVQKKLESWARSASVPFLDLTPVFRNAARRRSDLTWKLNGHWTPAGHELAANEIGAWLADDGVFSFIGPPR